MKEDEPIDLVYTWVDDTWPDYLGTLHQHADNSHDLNPNRTRDNIELIRYSLRSVRRYLPWIRTVYLLTQRPQVPKWLSQEAIDSGRIRLVHHDQIMDPSILPTFSSFAIVSHLHLLEGLSENFIYIEDDMAFTRSLKKSDFFDFKGRTHLYPRLGKILPARHKKNEQLSPWNCAQINISKLLNKKYGYKSCRAPIWHQPLMINKKVWQTMIDTWPDSLQKTRMAKFRSSNGIAYELLYPYFSSENGVAVIESKWSSYRESLYISLENSLWLTHLYKYLMRMHRGRYIALNDSFGEAPNGNVVKLLKKILNERFPWNCNDE